MKLKKKLLLVLVILTILWLLACFQHVSAYNQMIDEKKRQVGEEIVERLIDFRSVLSWGNGSLLFIIGLFLAMSWIFGICVFIKKLKQRRNGRSKIMPLMISGMILMLVVVSLRVEYAIQTVRATPEQPEENIYCYPNAIDLLFVGDEEFFATRDHYLTSSRPAWKTVQYRQYPRLEKAFLEDAGISIAFNGWLEWDSNDSEHELDFLLVEAMEETGWVPQSTYRDREIFGRNVSRRMDILVVITNQEAESPIGGGAKGFAMPKWAGEFYSVYLDKTVYWDAIIIDYQGAELLIETWLDYVIIQHELSHLFGATSTKWTGLGHCNHAKCVMCEAEVLFWAGACTWKKECLTYMRNWAETIPSEQYPPH